MSKLTCPWCERAIDIDAIETAGLWKERGEIAARIKPVWRIAIEYIDAFAVKPGGRILLKRRVRHLWGLVRLWEGCEFELQGKRYRTNKEAIRNGLLAVCEAQKVGFQNHNYLFKVLMPPASRVSVEGKTAKEETATEQEKLFKPKRDSELTELGDVVNAEEFKKKHGIESLADGVGER